MVSFLPIGGPPKKTELCRQKERSVRSAPKETEHTRHNFALGIMTEGMGPYESNCPVAILDLLTPTDRPYALQWRARCRANAAGGAKAAGTMRRAAASTA